ncbi:MAG: hypothetical protein K0U36_03835 [Alphaproteobacteria bacterium]|nr:hypothetical protein [Alphaproteobacteria bacterium]
MPSSSQPISEPAWMQLIAPLAQHPASRGLADDVGELPSLRPGERWIVTTDMVIEGRHLPLGTTPAQAVPLLIRRNLSDIAAGGGVPFGLTLNLAMTRTHFHKDPAVQIIDAVKKECTDFGLVLVGGDTSKIDSTSSATASTKAGKENDPALPFVLIATLFGIVTLASPSAHAGNGVTAAAPASTDAITDEALRPTSSSPEFPLARQNVRGGDRLWVSGGLGDRALWREIRKAHSSPSPSWVDRLWVSFGLGESALWRKIKKARPSSLPSWVDRCTPEQRAQLEARFWAPEPQLALGQHLADLCPHAGVIDLSDGLMIDVAKLVQSVTPFGCDIVQSQLPWSTLLPPADQCSRGEHDAIMNAMLFGGGDYELLIAAPAEMELGSLLAARGWTGRLTEIGRVTDTGKCQLDDGTKKIEFDRRKGYDSMR